MTKDSQNSKYIILYGASHRHRHCRSLGTLSSVNCPGRAIPGYPCYLTIALTIPLLKIFSKKYLKKMYNFFTMFFFGENLKAKHKVTLCLVMYGVLLNVLLWSDIPQMTLEELHCLLAFGTCIKCIVLCIFRKF